MLSLAFLCAAPAGAAEPRPNVLLILADDLTRTALGSYGNPICRTPNLDRLAASSLRFTRAYCQGTYCGPSRASFLSGYYPHAVGVLGYNSPRAALGERATWPQHFRHAGYHTARIGKVYHMGVPGGVEDLGPGRDYDGADDPASWSERWNTPGPEWRAAGTGETLERNPDGTKPVMGGNTFVVVEADGEDDEHHDGKAAAKAVEFLRARRGRPEPFFLAVGFVRPHVPFVAPRKYFAPYLPYENLPLPPKVPGDWDDLPKAGINYKTSVNMQLDERRQRKAIGGYYASVSFMDAQVGRVLTALEAAGLADHTIVIFTSDHGYHLGEHDFWAKVSLLEESAQVPLLVRVPGRSPGVRDALVELLDLFPTTAALCGLPVPERLQGRDLAPVLADPGARVRDTAFSVAPSSKGFLLRDDRFAFIQYQEDASAGIELYDLVADPRQYTNLARRPEHAATVAGYRERLHATLRAVRTNDLGR
ncbi:MAG: sulfatase [Opitutaceae bacterium]